MGTKIVAARLATSAGVTTVITRSSAPGNIFKIVKYLQATKTINAGTVAGTQASTADDGSAATTPIEAVTARLAALEALEKPPLHTRFLPLSTPVRDRYFWLLHGLTPHGTLYIDAGAHAALSDKAGLLPVGVLDVEGNFAQQEAVRLVVVDRPPVLAEVAGPVANSCAPTPSPSPASVAAKWESFNPIEVGRALVNYAAPEIARIKGRRSSKIGELLGYADSEYVAHRENIALFVGRESQPVSPVLTAVANTGGVAGYEMGA